MSKKDIVVPLPTLETVKNLIEDISPAVIYDKKWIIEGYEKCKKMLRESKSDNFLLSEIFAIYYYVSGFDDEHFRVSFDDGLLYYRLYRFKFPGFLSYYDGKELYVGYSENKKIARGDIIVKINGLPWIEYMEHAMKFMVYNFRSINNRVLASKYLFVDRGNPYLDRPSVIKLQNGGVVSLKYTDLNIYMFVNYGDFRVCYDFLRYYKRKETGELFIRIPVLENIDFREMSKLLPVKSIVLDIRDNPGGSIQLVDNFFRYFFDINLNAGIITKNSNVVVQRRNRINGYSMWDNLLKIPPVSKPSLTILYNENSLSACKLLIKLATIYVKNLKLIGPKVNLNKHYGTTVRIDGTGFLLIIPTTCYYFKK